METIHQYIENHMSDTVAKKKQNPIAALLVLAAGITSLVLTRTMEASDSLLMTLLTIGIIFTAVGFIYTAMNLSGARWHFIYTPTSCRMIEAKLYLTNADYREALNAIQGNDSLALSRLKPQVSSNSALNMLYSTDGALVLVQAGRYEGNRFEPETPVACFRGTDALYIMKLCK